MAGVSVEVINLKQVQQAFDQLKKNTTDLKPVFADIGEAMLNNTRDRLEAGSDIYGNAFVPLKPKTLKYKKKNRDKVLIDEGYLHGTLAYQLVHNGVELGSDRKYAAIHQFGSANGTFKKPSGIPARPFLGVTPQDEQEIINIIRDHISSKF